MRDTREGFIRDAPQYFEIKESGERMLILLSDYHRLQTCRDGFTGP
ncbi:hypothetical protein NG821_00860 [Prevotella cerevisiae]|uniref:Uncharacterized protein n=1 Tax=Segatella cerevisiae TaxID=2053716 RepID=A0ABT1BTJ8_9BACT|nr:hypothetical protein [Segatella cerevisiae]MCO6024406.1 hypothetical protein [Segatella cerevisiae]